MYSLKKTHKTIMFFGFFYIAAIYITYFFIGLGLLRTLHLFNFPGLFATIGAWISITFGLLNLKEYFFPNSPLKIRMPLSVRAKANQWAHKSTIPSAIVLGFLVGVSEFPCSGAVYLAILGYLRANETLLNGVLYLLIYNLMFVLPLILVYLVATNRVVTEKMINFQEKSGRKMHLVLAGVMIALGVIILFIT
jgi:cytochrome c biogenesis protein CcdA